MTRETLNTENYTGSPEKKVWVSPSFEVINKDRIKTGIVHAGAEGSKGISLPSTLSYAS